MNKFLVSMAAGLLVSTAASAQKMATPDVQFTTVDSVAISPVKNQKNAGTCWCYSSLAFLESELIRTKHKVYDLSEMFLVSKTYMERAEMAVRTHGDVSFSQGGSFYDVIYGMEKFGLVPDSEMPAGAMYGQSLSNHTELSALTDRMVEAVAKGRLRSLQFSPDGEPLWKKSVQAVHDIYLGKCPEKFTFEGKEYTPQSFYQSLGLKASDYVSLTSFIHHPYSTGANKGKGFVIEVQDNWRWASALNLELDDMMQVIDDNIKAGYTVAWASDVSEKGFNRDGVGFYNDEAAAETAGNDQAHWVGEGPAATQAKAAKPLPQKKVTAEERQRGYDGYETTDDHGMQIFGIAKDQYGNKYYMVKNSWGDAGKYHGIWYVTPEFVRAKTMNLVVNKNGVSKALRDKYGM